MDIKEQYLSSILEQTEKELKELLPKLEIFPNAQGIAKAYASLIQDIKKDGNYLASSEKISALAVNIESLRKRFEPLPIDKLAPHIFA